MHDVRHINAVVHGDDVLVEGVFGCLRWFEGELQKRLSITSTYLGPEKALEQEARPLNRTIHWESGGLTWEPDRRHFDILMEQLGVGKENTGSVVTPAVKERKAVTKELLVKAFDLVEVFACDGVTQDGASASPSAITQDGASASPAGTAQGRHLSDLSPHVGSRETSGTSCCRYARCQECTALQEVGSGICGVCENLFGRL